MRLQAGVDGGEKKQILHMPTDDIQLFPMHALVPGESHSLLHKLSKVSGIPGNSWHPFMKCCQEVKEKLKLLLSAGSLQIDEIVHPDTIWQDGYIP